MVVHVAVGVVFDPQGRILISRRHEHLHQGGLWEFPGGKVEPGESVVQALSRELQEESGILVDHSEPLIQIAHDYGDKQVLLDVWRIEKFSGVACGKEGQRIAWVEPEELNLYDFPAANGPIVKAAQLPDLYIITPSLVDELALNTFLDEQFLRFPQALIQIRQPEWLDERVVSAANQRVESQDGRQRLVVNVSPSFEPQMDARLGLHLKSSDLQTVALEYAASRLLSAACHNQDQLEAARACGADCALLSPVKSTTSHPGAPVLGWSDFELLAKQALLPVYALGGVGLGELGHAKHLGAQGIAGISAFLPTQC